MNEQLIIQTNKGSYPIYIGDSVLNQLNVFIDTQSPSKICIVTDEKISPLYLQKVLKILPNTIPTCTYVTKQGEEAKTIAAYSALLTFALENKLDRKSLFIALGGGTIGDLTGFVAATFMRGVSFIQIPTTILAHDSSIGGKTGINHPLGKNLIGAFHHPIAVFYCLSFLESLPKNEVRSGFAEIIKEAFISPVPFIQELKEKISNEAELNAKVIFPFLIKGMETKKYYVEQDEREEGVRAFLNFGHTLGHALENELGYGTFTHGEAVLIGMIYALRLSEKVFQLHFPLKPFIDWVKNLHYTTELPQTVNDYRLLQRMAHDKKAISGKYRFVLLKQIGKPTLHEVDEKILIETLKEMRGF